MKRSNKLHVSHVDVLSDQKIENLNAEDHTRYEMRKMERNA